MAGMVPADVQRSSAGKRRWVINSTTLSLKTCIAILNFASSTPGVLEPKELAEIEGLRNDLTAQIGRVGAAREKHVAARKVRKVRAGTVKKTLTAGKGILEVHSTMLDERTPLSRLGLDVFRFSGLKALSGRFQQALAKLPGDALTNQVRADLDTAVAAFDESCTEVDARWADTKKAREELDGQLRGIQKRIACYKAILAYRLSDEDAVRLKGALSTTRARVTHRAVPTSASDGNTVLPSGRRDPAETVPTVESAPVADGNTVLPSGRRDPAAVDQKAA